MKRPPSESPRRRARATSRTAWLLTGALLLFSSGCPEPPTGIEPVSVNAPPRHVIVIVIDALRADHLGAYGYERTTSPQLDRLADQGIVFTRAYSAAPWTLPAIASLMTSVYPSVHGLRRPPTTPDQSSLPDGLITLAESLRDHGFRTASITSQPWMSDATGLTQGFDEARVVAHASAPGEAGMLTEALILWLATNRSSRFFLYAHFMGPHSPYDVPSAHSGRFTGGRAAPPTIAEFQRLYEYESEVDAYTQITDRARERGLDPDDIEYLKAEYDEKLAYTDESVGTLLRYLEESGLLDDSLLVVTADHGEAFFEHGTIFHGQNLHEELVRVPLIVRLPGASGGRARIGEVVELIDLYPTIHELLGFATPGYIQGKSLLPVLRGGPSDGLAYAEYYGFKIVTPQWSSFHEYGDGLHDPDEVRLEELYDLERDPLERHNLVGRNLVISARHRELARRLQGRMNEISKGNDFHAPEITLDPETIRKLESLGYLGGGS